jgi:hypothetical protein
MGNPGGYLIEVGGYTKLPSTGSTTAVNLASDKQRDVRNFAPAYEGIRSLVRRAIGAAIYAQVEPPTRLGRLPGAIEAAER